MRALMRARSAGGRKHAARGGNFGEKRIPSRLSLARRRPWRISGRMASSAVALLEALKAQPEVARLLAASGLAHASPAVLGAALLATLLALLAVLASLSKALFGRKDLPPTVACLPIVGGFIRFLKARCALLRCCCPAHAARGPQRRRTAQPRPLPATGLGVSAALAQLWARRSLGLGCEARSRPPRDAGPDAADDGLVQEAGPGVHRAAVSPPRHVPDRPGSQHALLQGTARRHAASPPRATDCGGCRLPERASALAARIRASRAVAPAKPSPAPSWSARRLAAPRPCRAPRDARRGCRCRPAPVAAAPGAVSGSWQGHAACEPGLAR